MRKLLIMAAFSLLAGKGSYAQIQKLQDIVGEWEIVGEPGVKASLLIIDSSTIILNYMNGRKIITQYSMDFSKSPCWFDFTTKDSASALLQVKSLIQKIGDDVLKWQVFIDEERSPYFTNYTGKLLYLKKSKQQSGEGITAAGH